MSINLSRRSFLLGGAAVLGSFALTACGGNSASSSSSAATSGAAASGSASDGTVITVGASPSPHAEILKAVEDEIKSAGYELKVVEYNDYVQPNVALSEGDLDANYFQHKPYLDNYNQENGTDLVSAAAIHFEPMGIYAGKSSDIKNVPDGAKIAVPSDATNEARALLLLQDQGVLKLKDGAGLEATKNDIAENPHNITFQEVEAAAVPRTLQSVDFAVINGNYAIEAGYHVKDALAHEKAGTTAVNEYANIICTTKEKEDDTSIKALVKVLQSDDFKKYLEENFGEDVLPAF